jgi:phosphate transport system substrate-binding protein
MEAGSMKRIAAYVAAGSVACLAPASAAATLTIAGSTTLLPFVTEAAQTYQSQHADVLMVVSGGGSRAALAQVAGKQIDMAATDVPPTGSTDLVDHRIAVIAFAIAVDPKAGVQNLTRAQIADVFAGRITNWKALGGADLPIVVVNRPPGSGVRALVAQQVMGGAQFARSPLEDESTSSLLSDLRSNPGSIGYASFGGLRDSGLVLASIDGVAPAAENVENGTYPLWAYEHIITNGPATPDESRFLAFLQTNRALLRQYGYIAVHDMKVAPPGT